MKKYMRLMIILLLTLLIALTGCSGEKNEADKSDVEQTVSADITPLKDADEHLEEQTAVDATEQPLEQQENAEGREEAAESKQEREQQNQETQEQQKSQEPQNPQEQVKEEPSNEVAQEGPVLTIDGKVSNKVSYDLRQLKAMDSLIYSAEYYSLNSFGTTGHTSFKGVKLWGLLSEKAGIADNASSIRIVAVDGYEMTFTVEQIKRQDYMDETDNSKKLPVIIAWVENGQEYSNEDGPPYKLVIGQKEPGDVNKPQWVSNINRIIVE